MQFDQDIQRIAASLARRSGTGAEAAHVADVVVQTFHAIDAALSPTLGVRGVAALRNRSLHLAARTQPWLLVAPNRPADTDWNALCAVLSSQTPAAAAHGGAVLLNSFHALLTSLLGPSLTKRLLRSVWITLSDDLTPQDSAT